MTALTITHSAVATAADDPSAEINKAEWNDSHVIAGDYLRKATVTLSSAQLLALHTTPITLVAAPGAGKWLAVHRILWFYSYGTVQYASSTTSEPYLGYGTLPLATGADIVSDADDIVKGGDLDLPGSVASDLVNKTLAVQTDGAGQEFTLGDGTLTVSVWYSIEDVPA